MKKLSAFCSAIFISGFLFAFLVHPAFAEPPLWEIYNTVYGGAYVTDDLDLETTYGAYDETFIEMNGHVHASARFAGYTQSFGYYTDLFVGSNRVELLDVTSTNYFEPWEFAIDFNVPSVFGLYLHPYGSAPPDTWWFSQPLLNAGGNLVHMQAFYAPDYDPVLNVEYFIGWEDQNLGDADYNDLVLVMQLVEPYPVEYCEVNGDCDDLDNCTDDVCVDHVCQYTPKDCSHLDDQCILGVCDPNTGNCVEDLTAKNGESCDDGDPCTVDDICADGACAGSPKDCSHLDDQCIVGVCNPSTGDCEEDLTAKNGELCDDDDVCTEDDICSDGVCAGTPIPDCPCNTKIYRGGVCEESSPLDTIYNRPGRRGLAITCCEYEEFCVCSSCYPEAIFTWTVTILPGSDPDFTLGDLVAFEGTGDTFMLKVKDPCTEHCPDEIVELEVCVEDQFGSQDCVIVTIGRVALGLGSANAHPNTQTTDIDLLLWNPENHVRALQTDICGCEMEDCSAYTTEDTCGDTICGQTGDDTACNADEACQWKTVGGVPQCVNALNCNWVGGDIGCAAQDNMVCTECVVDEDRTPEYVCSAREQANGCCRVTLYSTEPEDLIQQGSGAIARIKYDILGDLTSKDCVCLWPFERKVSDQFNEELCACPKAGEICFRIYGDIYPQDCYQCQSCGDGVVDLFDILEGIDIILGLQTATECQELHGDVPLGMPPYCGNPAGVNPPNCETDEIIDIFDDLVIIDKALGRMNCCDYCMYGEIY